MLCLFISFSLKQFLSLFLAFMTKHFWRLQTSYLVECTSVWVCLPFPDGEDNGTPPQCSCLENPRDGGAWWADVNGVTQSRTRLKWLSSSSHFLKVGFRLCMSITQVKQCFSNCILSDGTQFQFVPLLTKFSFITWFRWCLPNFSTVKFISLGN